MMREEDLRQKLGIVCGARHLIMGEAWVQKVLQLKQVKPLVQALIWFVTFQAGVCAPGVG